MAVKFLQISLLLGCLCSVFFSCNKTSGVSEVPAIELSGVKHLSSPTPDVSDSFYFTLKFIDGDGDLGYSQADTTGEFSVNGKYYFNVVIEYLEYFDGGYHHVKPFPSNIDTIQFGYRLPVLKEGNKKKTIRGEILIPISMDIPPVKSDVCRFRIYIYDRALHKSNEVETRDQHR